jgi:ribonucleotide reductase alpha subunit
MEESQVKHIAIFELNKSFVRKYKDVTPPFGWKSGPNSVGEITTMRTYSRILPNGRNEQWYQVCERVVNGCYRMQERHIRFYNLDWDEDQAQRSAQEMYDRMFHMKFLPPGRGLWCMGTMVTEERGIFSALNNCAFVSTDNLDKDKAKPFLFLMDMSMLGVGVGFDTKGANKLKIRKPKDTIKTYIIPDSREGWVESIKKLILSYTDSTEQWKFNYSVIRPAGLPIKCFGGISSGPEPLKILHIEVKEILERRINGMLTIRDIVDIMNMIGKCVVAGNVRRTAEIAFGEPYSDEFLNLKNYKKYPERQSYGRISNNSIFAEIGQSYEYAANLIKMNGEPGLFWKENAQKYGRMKDPINNKDLKIKGANPCMEQSLESYEMCCLVETFPFKCSNIQDYLRTLKFAYLYAKSVTLGESHWPETNKVQLRNRRIGCSDSGVVQFVDLHGLDTLKQWCDLGYDTVQRWDTIYSDWLCVPRSIKTTSIKPSGSVSLVSGATPGVHYPISNYHIRRITIKKNSQLVKLLTKAGYFVENSKYEIDSMIVEIPVEPDRILPTEDEVTIWEQLNLAIFMQEHWADNQVSCTVKFDPLIEGDQINSALNFSQYKLKGISFLPSIKKALRKKLGIKEYTDFKDLTEEEYLLLLEENGYKLKEKIDFTELTNKSYLEFINVIAKPYAQMPYETISKEKYLELTKDIKKIDFSLLKEDAMAPKFCDSESCEL